MDAQAMTVLVQLFTEMTFSGFMGLIWWLERQDRKVYRDKILDDWTRDREHDHTERLTGKNTMSSTATKTQST